MDKIQAIAVAMRELTYSEMRQLSRELSQTAKETVRSKYNFIELSETLNGWSENRTRPLAVEPAAEEPVMIPINASENISRPVEIRTESPAPANAAEAKAGP